RATSFAQSAHDLDSDIQPLGFETAFSSVTEDFREARNRLESARAVRNEHGHLVRPISRLEGDQLVWELAQKQSSQTSIGAENILLRRLTQKLPPHFDSILPSNQALVSDPIPSLVEPQPAPPEVLEGLYAIKITSFDQSFASRLYGHRIPPTTVFFQDWETMSPWMELMADVISHYRISHPLDHDNSPYTWAPVTYTPIYASHLPQIHDLLERTFWPGIDGKSMNR
ncbi:hypothetical protein FRC09_013081, partial [Ceratobasidium sp. 395]